MNNGFTLNGVASDTYGIIMLGKNRTVLPQSNDLFMQIPGRDGSYLFNRELADRIIEVTCSVIKQSTADLRSAVRQIAAMLYAKQRVQLIFDDEPNVYYMAKYDGAIGLDQKRTAKMGQFTLIFRCEPYAYSLTPKTQNFIADAISITNEGTAPSSPKFIATFTASATEFKVWFGNYFIRIVRNFIIGDILVIDNVLSKITLNGLDTMLGYDLNSRFFSIGSGPNTLNVTPTTKATTIMAWKERYF